MYYNNSLHNSYVSILELYLRFFQSFSDFLLFFFIFFKELFLFFLSCSSLLIFYLYLLLFH